MCSHFTFNIINMSNATPPKDIDVEKQDNDQNNKTENNEPFEEVTEKPPPGINGFLVFLYGIFFSMFVIGWINLNSCSINRLIPIYLIVAGTVGALAKFFSKTSNKYVCHLVVVLLVFYGGVWNSLGTYWVYSEYQPNYDPVLGKYCDRTTYLFAFWILTLQYTLLGFFILLSACYMLMRGDFKKK